MTIENRFTTHTGEVVTGDRLSAALNRAADAWADNARAIREEDAYGSHVTEAEKDRYLGEQLDEAERIRTGTGRMSFTLWQRINAELTGECVPMLSRGR